ncbi:hypothetical protein [Gloeothece verrucosa]|uniref:Uncharacterized protein n=1 Tax=Gloeothece verrucosa (strain PCC 7822) TaxID=497965 RepID=E0UMQ0_GLOV7|nr:hypothetical protein [Gloeothece verrucosa]ADN18230.1 hypothetical protein Cyan7822_6447 [Gloeothece verrucosa PCC 7822]
MNINLQNFLKNVYHNHWNIDLAVNFLLKLRHQPEVAEILQSIWEESLIDHYRWTDTRKMLYVFLKNELSILKDIDLDSRRG